jgi:hypothetical protein
MSYRHNSSAWTGRAPRTTAERWPSLPMRIPGFWRRLLILICGH